jgi:acyl dehydratase
MNYPNRLHYDEAFAAQSVFGRLVAPQSFAVCSTQGHGSLPSVQGEIPGSHMLFGGDEWWFFGPRLEPGDITSVTRMVFDFREATTRFAGPTVFQRGDTTYVNQRGEPLAIQRSTSIRFIVENARRLGFMMENTEYPRWSAEQLEALEVERLDYYGTFHDHVLRTFADVGEVGSALPRRPMGPHSVRTLATEWRAFIDSVWGATEPDAVGETPVDQGWLEEMKFDLEKAAIDPALADGLYAGQSKGHANAGGASVLAIPRAYGYGASMGAWVLDYVAAWAGEHGLVAHSDVQYRSPAFEGDATYLDATITAKGLGADGVGRVDLDVVMSNQLGQVLAKGPATVRYSR